jgi:hypothetical protein
VVVFLYSKFGRLFLLLWDFIHLVAVFSCNGFMEAWRDTSGSAILELRLVFGPPVLRVDMIDDIK